MWMDSDMAVCSAYRNSDLVSRANLNLLLFTREIQICCCLEGASKRERMLICRPTTERQLCCSNRYLRLRVKLMLCC